MALTRRRSLPSKSARAFLTAIAVLAVSHRATAQQEPIDLTYRAYEGCPSERRFVEMVLGRAAKTLVLSERARGRKFHVSVARERKETTGRLEIVANGVTASREVAGANCAEVVSALALFTALAIDPSARVDASSEPRADETPAEPKSEPKPEPKPEPVEPIAIPPPVERDVRRPTEPRARVPELLAGARAMGAGGFEGGSATPAVARGGGLFVQWVTPRFGAYRASGAYFAETDNALASFRFFEARADGCPYRAELVPRLILEPCVALEVGRVQATAKANPTLTPSTERRWWVAADLLARGRFAPFPWIFAEVEAGVAVPFTRDVIWVGSPTDVRGEAHRVPAVGWVLGLGLGARIL